MASEDNAADSGGGEGRQTDIGGSSPDDNDEENNSPATSVPNSRVSFVSPQDITSEQISFAADAGAHKASVEGIVEYGKGPAAASKTASAKDVNTGQLQQGRPELKKNQSSVCLRKNVPDSPLLSSRSKRRQSSLDRRKCVPDSLLLNDRNAISDEMNVAVGSLKQKSLEESELDCFRRLVLNPSYPLRRQMLLTFGSVSSLAILLVMISSIVSSIATGNFIKEQSSKNVEDWAKEWVDDYMGATSRYVAEALSPKIMPNDLIDLMVEIARDRFAGYPSTEDDNLTPFFDTESQTNVYPLKNKPLPLEWNFSHTPNEGGNVNAENSEEHVPNRWSWYSAHPRLSTEVAMYHMQGACDPRATNSSAMVYHPNCTDANNDISTGGVIAPSPTNEQVYRKAADLSPFLKAMYEYYYNILQLGYYFSNSGAGSSILFPHYELDSSGSYNSTGCEWMRTPNPINATLGPIGTEEEIDRCHGEDTSVPTREYNPLERAWCQDQALNPQRVQNTGPYIDAFSADKRWMMTVGKAVYDHVTGAFITCIAVDFSLEEIDKILDETKVDKLGVLSLVRNDKSGTVVTSPKFDFDNADDTTAVDDPMLETGVNQEMFLEIKSIVNFSQPWDPQNASSLYQDSRFESEEHIVSAYPMPSIPDDYDLAYEPDFFAIFSWPKAQGLAPTLNNVNEEVENDVRSIVLITVLIGLGGLFVVILFIFVTASWLAEPLKWMQNVGDQVVGKFGEELDSGINYERKALRYCSPKTELSSLAEEFSKMVTRFSGEGTAKRAHADDTEKMNLFDFSEEFAGLYRSRDDSAFEFKYPKASTASNAREGQAPLQCNLGPNTRSSSKSSPGSSALGTTDYSRKVYKSPLFLWMVGLMVTPTLVTTVVISAVVVWHMYNQLPSLVEPVKDEYLLLKDSYRISVTELLAVSASTVSEKAARDSHLLNRFSSWLYFGGMEVSGSFTDVIEGAEECKTAPSSSECEWLKDMPCDCGWNDFSVRGKADACTEYLPGQSRTLQKVHFEGQSQDTWLDGSRNSTSFPKVASHPNTTAWWDNITVLPHSTGDSVSSKYGTTHDRVKIISALSTVFIPLYNYDTSNTKLQGVYVGFEADGMMAGYTGCAYGFVDFPFWRSEEDNGAAKLHPELCPLGKYGYDARCRSWYHDGKLKGNLHITAPYIYASTPVVGQSVTAPLIDPGSGNHIGQTLVDFLPEPMFEALKSDNIELSGGGFPVLITPEKDALDHDTVVGPGYSIGDGGEAIENLLPDATFQPILQKMKAGERGNDTFSHGHNMYIAYAPVLVRNCRPLNSSNIASGVKCEDTLAYSLALAENETVILKSFQSSIDVDKTVDICIGVLAAVIVISAILLVFIAFRVTSSMTEPILKLLGVIKDINCSSMRLSNDDINKLSDFKGSCSEVDSVYKTIEMLYKVVQFANHAFFSGDLEVAYQVLRDALRLFVRLDNKKAVAVASNNLGNTMLTIYRTMKAVGCDEMCGLTKKEVIEKGTAHFAHSIKLGEEAYDEFYNAQGWSEECLVFMQFLSNRYFNRAIFFLTSSFDNEYRKEAESLGFRDLQITADMDVEIVDQCLEMGFKINQVERYELMMGRLRGLLSMVELGFSPDELCIEDRIADAHQSLKTAMKNPSHALFREISVAGRMQKLDLELMKYFSLAKKDVANAARVAIRMLIEDEYIFPDAEQEAIMMILIFMNRTMDENCPKDEDGHIYAELQSAVETLDQKYVKRAEIESSINRSGLMRSLTIRIGPGIGDDNDEESADVMKGTKARTERRSSAIRESTRGDVTMELF